MGVGSVAINANNPCMSTVSWARPIITVYMYMLCKEKVLCVAGKCS